MANGFLAPGMEMVTKPSRRRLRDRVSATMIAS
jgi:hypothetical protein